MKRSLHILSLTALIATASVITTLAITPAQANKRASIETGDIAYVDVFTLVDRALSAEDKTAARDNFNVKSTKTISGLQQQLQGLQTKLTGMTKDDPNAGATYQQYQQLQYQLDSTSKQINSDYQTLIANQIAGAYNEIYIASNEIGHQEGFTFVFATRSDGELVQKDTITGITQEILARPLMTPPTGVDLTEQVRVKLGYPEKAPKPDADAQPDAQPDAQKATPSGDADESDGDADNDANKKDKDDDND